MFKKINKIKKIKENKRKKMEKKVNSIAILNLGLNFNTLIKILITTISYFAIF